MRANDPVIGWLVKARDDIPWCILMPRRSMVIG